MLVSDRVNPCVSCLIILITTILTDWADCVLYIEVYIAVSENINILQSQPKAIRTDSANSVESDLGCTSRITLIK